jgi:hypothetical protein
MESNQNKIIIIKVGIYSKLWYILLSGVGILYLFMYILTIISFFTLGIGKEDIAYFLGGTVLALVFVYPIYISYKIFRLQIKLDFQKHICTFRQTTKSFSLSKNDLEWWAIRRYSDFVEPGGPDSWKYHFECKLNSGSRFIYPLTAGSGDVWGPKKEDSKYQYYVEIFSDCLQTKPKELSRIEYPHPFMSQKKFARKFWKASDYEGTDIDNSNLKSEDINKLLKE